MRLWSKETMVEIAFRNSVFTNSTLAKNFDLNWIEKDFLESIKMYKNQLKSIELNLKKLMELNTEYNLDRKQFILNYYKKLKNKLLKKREKYPLIYGKIVYLLEKLQNQQ